MKGIRIFLCLAMCTGMAALPCACQQTGLGEALTLFIRYPALYTTPSEFPYARSIYREQNIANEISRPGIDLTDHLAFFCKLEVMSDRKTRIPFRVRLGTVDYVDRLEQKRPGAEYLRPGRITIPRRPHAPH